MSYGVSSSNFLPPLPQGAPRLLPEGDGGAHLDVLGGGATAIIEDDLATHGGLILLIVLVIGRI